MDALAGSSFFLRIIESIKTFNYKPIYHKWQQSLQLFALDAMLLTNIATWFIKNTRFPFYIPVLLMGIFLVTISFLGCIAFLVGLFSGGNSSGIKSWMIRPVFKIGLTHRRKL